METKSIQLKTLFAAVVLISALETIGTIAPAFGPLNLLVIGVIRLLDILGLLSVVLLMEKNVSCIGLYRSGFFSALRKGVLWSIGFGLLASITALVVFLSGVNPIPLIKVQLPGDTVSLLLLFLVGGIVGPAAEEIFFRGLIFVFFRRWGFLFSLCFSTLIFAALHPTATGIPVPQLVGALLFAVSFEIEKNLLVPTIIHILGNLAIFSIAMSTC